MSKEYKIIGKQGPPVWTKRTRFWEMSYTLKTTCFPVCSTRRCSVRPGRRQRLKKLDVSKARALPGVECVMTAGDVPNNESVKNVVGQTTEVGLLEAKLQVLAKDRVRYYGEPIAIIAAETLDIAEDALELIDVEYEDLPAVFDPLEARKPDAPRIHGKNNIIASWKLRKGDVEKGFCRGRCYRRGDLQDAETGTRPYRTGIGGSLG